MRIPQLIRIKHIIDLLNDCEYHKNQEIIDYLDDKLDICYNASTIEKEEQTIKYGGYSLMFMLQQIYINNHQREKFTSFMDGKNVELVRSRV